VIVIKNILLFLRWRLVPVRYLERLSRLNLKKMKRLDKPLSHVALAVESKGFAQGPTIASDLLQELQSLFKPRVNDSKTTKLRKNHPFVNLTRAEDLTPENPLMKFAVSKEVLDVAMDYFGGRATLNSIQVLYSFPNLGETLKESQKWHLDYSDTRSFHCVAYLNDVEKDEDGAFVYVDKVASETVGRSMIIHRYGDEEFKKASNNAKWLKFFGEAGTSVLIDPAACYHYGSRCTKPRLAIFVTFNSDFPFNGATPLVKKNASKIAKTIKTLRPDLDSVAVDRLLMI